MYIPSPCLSISYFNRLEDWAETNKISFNTAVKVLHLGMEKMWDLHITWRIVWKHYIWAELGCGHWWAWVGGMIHLLQELTDLACIIRIVSRVHEVIPFSTCAIIWNFMYDLEVYISWMILTGYCTAGVSSP